MKLNERYRPQTLAEVVGQPPARVLARFARDPHSECFLLEGPPGCGKTTSAYALANELGCTDEFSGRHTVIASELLIDEARDVFGCTLRLRPLQGNGWRVLVIEELENLNEKVQTYLKVALETMLPEKCVVVATTNGAGKLSEALLQRFKILVYSGGPVFAQAARDHIAAVWTKEFGDVPLPHGWDRWGWQGDTFSLRAALSQLENAGLMLEEVA